MHEGQSRASLCGVFCAKGTGDPQIVIRGQASHGHSSVPIIRALGDVPSAPILGDQWRRIGQLSSWAL